jgi:hypothetical protein
MLCIRITNKDRFIAIEHGGETLLLHVRLEPRRDAPILTMFRGPKSFRVLRGSLWIEERREQGASAGR